MGVRVPLEVELFNVIRYLLVTVIVVPVLEYLVRATIKASARRHLLRSGNLRWNESSLGVVTVHGRYYSASSRIAVYVAGASMLIGLSLIEFGIDSVAVDVVKSAVVRAHHNKYVWYRNMSRNENEYKLDHFADDIRRQGATVLSNMKVSLYMPQKWRGREVSVLSACIVKNKRFPYREGLQERIDMLRKMKQEPPSEEVVDRIRIVERNLLDMSSYRRLSPSGLLDVLESSKTASVRQTIYGAEKPVDRFAQGLKVRNVTFASIEAIRTLLGFDALTVGVEKVGGTLRPVGSYKSMLFNRYMGCVALGHGSGYAVCFINVAEFKKNSSHPSKWQTECEGPVTEKAWGFEAGQIGAKNKNFTVLVAHGMLLNYVLYSMEHLNRKSKGLRVIVIISAIAKLEIEQGALHTLSVNNILYTQEIRDLIASYGEVNWSTLTAFLDKLSSMIVDPTTVARVGNEVRKVKKGETMHPLVLTRAVIGVLLLLLSEVVVLLFLVLSRQSGEHIHANTSSQKETMTNFEVGDDVDYMFRLAAEEKRGTGQSLKPPNVNAGLGLIQRDDGTMGMGIIVQEPQPPVIELKNAQDKPESSTSLSRLGHPQSGATELRRRSPRFVEE